MQCSTGWNGLVMTDQMCIGGSSASPCYHDGGVPAVWSNVVYGVYSFPDLQPSGSTYPQSTSCNNAKKPGVFIQVNKYLQWINSNMK